MPDPVVKLAEAAFFLALFEALELSDESLTNGHSQEAEASYLFSAVLGAFYSALYQWRLQTGNNRRYQAFKKLHPEIHASTEQGGWRNTTVHLSHVAISGTQLVSTMAMDAHARIQASKLAERDDIPFGRFQVHLPQYCVDYRGESRPVLAFCQEHYGALRNLFGEVSS